MFWISFIGWLTSCLCTYQFCVPPDLLTFISSVFSCFSCWALLWLLWVLHFSKFLALRQFALTYLFAVVCLVFGSFPVIFFHDSLNEACICIWIWIPGAMLPHFQYSSSRSRNRLSKVPCGICKICFTVNLLKLFELICADQWRRANRVCYCYHFTSMIKIMTVFVCRPISSLSGQNCWRFSLFFPSAIVDFFSAGNLWCIMHMLSGGKYTVYLPHGSEGKHTLIDFNSH